MPFAKNKNWMRPKKIDKQTVLIYCLIIVPVLCNLLIYFHASSSVKKNANLYFGNMLKELSIHIDEQQKYNNAVFTTITSQPLFRDIISDGNNIQHGEKTIHLQQYLSAQKTLLSNPPDIFIVFPASNFVISSTYASNTENYFKSNYDSTMQYDEWYSDVCSQPFGFSKQILNDDHEPCIEMHYKYQEYPSSPPEAVIIVRMGKSVLFNNPNSMLLDNDINLFIFNKGLPLLKSSSSAIQPSYNSDSNTFIATEKKDVVLTESSTINTWQYVLVVPNKLYNSQSRYIQTINTLNIVLSCILSFILCYYLVIRYRRQIKKLSNVFSKNYNISKSSEYEVLKESIDYYLEEVKNYSKNVYVFERNAKLQYIADLLQGSHYMEKHDDIKWVSNVFCVVIFKINNFENVFSDNTGTIMEEQFQFIFTIIQNVVNELVEKKHPCHTTYLHGRICSLINVSPEQNNSFFDDLKNALNEANSFIKEHFHFTFTAYSGKTVIGIENIPKSYQNAETIQKYNTSLTNDTLISIHVSPEISIDNEIGLVLKCEKQLKSAIEKKDYAQASAVLNDFRESLNSVQYPVQMIKFFILELNSTLFKLLISTSEMTVEELSSKFDDIFENITTENFYEKTDQLLQELCAYDGENNNDAPSEEHHSELINSILTYIEKEYSDCNLSITAIGSYFNIAPYYTSRIFKQAMNIGLSEYISNYRIEKAKILLVNTDESIEQIAYKVGFSSLRTFNRAFLKYESVTPSKYRNSANTNKPI